MAYCLSLFKKVSPFFPLTDWCWSVCVRVGGWVCVCVRVAVGGDGRGCSILLIFCCSHADCLPDNTTIVKLNLPLSFFWGGKRLISLGVKGPVINSSRLKDRVTILHLDTIISNWIRGSRPPENGSCFTGSQLDAEMQPISVSNICNQPATVSPDIMQHKASKIGKWELTDWCNNQTNLIKINLWLFSQNSQAH